MIIKVTTIVLLCFTMNGEGTFNNKTTIAYDAGEILSKIFSTNFTQPRRLIKFENQFHLNDIPHNGQHLPSVKPGYFEMRQETNNNYLKDDNRDADLKFDDFIEQAPETFGLNSTLSTTFKRANGKKKRRRRKLRQQFPGQPGFWNSGYPVPNVPVSGPSQSFALGSPPDQSFGPTLGPGQNYGFASGPSQNYELNGFQSDPNGQFIRPSRRPQSSLASAALTAVTGALTSIAHNDDYQCVPRLLCEAAAGGALGGSSILESISGLQPLLTLLSAYNGISSNPLFVFGRAAFLGMSSKGNSGSCRYAYPLCPTDPEEMVHYLNNHNGGFFRFFNAPQHGQQNVEQFYNQLSQNYGLDQPNSGNNQEFYGLLNPNLYQNPGAHQQYQQHLYPNGYGYQQNYGFAYPYHKNYNNGNGISFNNDNYGNDVRVNKDKNNIEKRIQNKPASFLNDDSAIGNSKWLFPDEHDYIREENKIVEQYNNDESVFTNNRKGKAFKFPNADISYGNNNIQEYDNNPIKFYTTEDVRMPKAIFFPESHRNIINYNTIKYYNPEYSPGGNYLFNNVDEENKLNFKGDNYNPINYNEYQNEPGVTTVYVVRGNGDPSKPEIIRLRLGDTL